MRIVEKTAIHILLYCVAAALFMNIELAFGYRVQGWNLPVVYVLYVLGLAIFHKVQGTQFGKKPLVMVVALPVIFIALAFSLSHTFDTTWDGEDYQQSSVIALAQGWNPWQTDALPFDASSGTDYAVGYPKTTWLLQSGIYKMIGHVQAAVSLSFVAAGVALVLLYAALQRLRISRGWSITIACLAVLQIHFLQQVTTFMSDGYSYELSLAAIASFILLIKERQKTLPLLGLLSSSLIMVGTKFSNLLFCGIIAGCTLVYIYVSKLYKQRFFYWVFGSFLVVAAVLLWVPYGTNTLRHSSPVYPQNHSAERVKLRYDNVPLNLKDSGHASLLLYGLFGQAQPRDAGGAVNPKNVAHFKVPFSFHWYEVQPTGRVGNGGVWFGGIILLAAVLYGLLAWRKPPGISRQAWWSATAAVLLIFGMAFVTPVPNMLRYTPLLSIVPLIVLLLLASTDRDQRPGWTVWGMQLLTLCLLVNIALPLYAVTHTRLNDIQTINRQLNNLRRQHNVYHVHATHFYTNYLRLKDAGVPFVIDEHANCAQPQTLIYTYDTTIICPKP